MNYILLYFFTFKSLYSPVCQALRGFSLGFQQELVFLCFGHLDKAFLFCSGVFIRLSFYVSVYNIIKKLETAVKRGKLLGHKGGLSLNFSDFYRQRSDVCSVHMYNYNARTIRMLRALWSYTELGLTNSIAFLTLAIL